MNLNNNIVEYMQNVCSVAQLVGIETLAIEPGIVRGCSEDRTVAILQDENVPEIVQGMNYSIGLSRLNVFQTRLNVLKTLDSFQTIYTIRDNTDYIFNLTFKSKQTKIEYRCTDPSRIEARRKINDPLINRIQYTPDFVDMLTKAVAAMGSEYITIIYNSEGVAFELHDNNNDVFKHVFATSTTSLNDTVTFFAKRYPAKLLMSVLKKEPTGYFDIGTIGLLKVKVQDVNVCLVPIS